MAKQVPGKAAACTRPIEEQWSDRTARRADHPRKHLGRLELLDDEGLDEYRSRFPAEATLVFDQFDALEAELEARSPDIEGVRPRLETRGLAMPLLSVVVCMSCGAHGVVSVERSWAVDRAMRRTGRSERDVVFATEMLERAFTAASFGWPDLDKLETEHVDELRILRRQTVDLVHLATDYAFAVLDGADAPRRPHRARATT